MTLTKTEQLFTMSVAIATVVLLFCVIYPCQGQVFTSVVDLEKVLYAEKDLSVTIRDYIKIERERLTQLEEVAENFAEHSAGGLANPEKQLGNLISAFLNVKHFTVDWQGIVDMLLSSRSSNDLMNQIYRQASSFPCYDDLTIAAQNVFRLQDTYALTTANMAHGKVPGIDGKQQLSAADCFQLGKLAYNKNDYYHTILWIEHALTEANNTHAISDMYDYLNFAYYQQDNVKYAAVLAKKWLTIDPTSIRAFNNLQHYELMLTQQKEQVKYLKEHEQQEKEIKKNVRRPYTPWTDRQLHHDYEAMCRGEKTDYVNPFQHQLSCSLKRTHPMFYLTPLKEEVLHMDPLIRVYHDILAPSEKKIMKELAIPRLHRSVVFESGDGQAQTDYRMSKTAWIADNEHPLVRQISKKAGVIANLNLATVELLQVLNYGIGGHYEPHLDYSTSKDEADFSNLIGNRIATVIFYIEDVEAGGATAFPEIGVTVTPEAGAAGMWYNLKKSGMGDSRTIHGACPVLAGSKWVATKWFHERGQEFIRPCDTDPFL